MTRYYLLLVPREAPEMIAKWHRPSWSRPHPPCPASLVLHRTKSLNGPVLSVPAVIQETEPLKQVQLLTKNSTASVLNRQSPILSGQPRSRGPGKGTEGGYSRQEERRPSWGVTRGESLHHSRGSHRNSQIRGSTSHPQTSVQVWNLNL
jgi:hypothetical protein